MNVIYDGSAELEAACSALTDIVVYFQRVGFEIAPKVSLRFADRDAARSFQQVAAHGYFNAPQSQIVVYRTSDVSPWGLVWSAKLAASFLRHELAHMAILAIVGGSQVRLGHEWHEFIDMLLPASWPASAQMDDPMPSLRASWPLFVRTMRRATDRLRWPNTSNRRLRLT